MNSASKDSDFFSLEREDNGLLPLFSASENGSKDKFPLIISGPCSVESSIQIEATASGLAKGGISFLRGGIWKPRTRPGSFEGVGASGLPWLVSSARKYGMIPLTEIATPIHLNEALNAGIADFWIGARTSVSPFAMQELADAFAVLDEDVKSSVTVLVKNPVNPDLDLWIGGLQRLYGAGLRRLGAIHRGFAEYSKSDYRNAPHWGVPIELKRRIPNLKIICDPSHIAGKSELVPEVSRQALRLNFDGLIIESHIEPSRALSDAGQQLTPRSLIELVESLQRTNTESEEVILDSLRTRIDAIDDELLSLIAKRMEISDEIGLLKHEAGMSVIQPHRYKRLMEERVALGVSAGLSEKFIHKLLSAIHEESVTRQLKITK